jgi:hypothetical protein
MKKMNFCTIHVMKTGEGEKANFPLTTATLVF